MPSLRTAVERPPYTPAPRNPSARGTEKYFAKDFNEEKPGAVLATAVVRSHILLASSCHRIPFNSRNRVHDSSR
jgi:hypothetical protein